MGSRRKFLKLSAGALTAAAARPLFGAGIQGANNRIRMGVIGCGSRSARVFDALARHADCQFLTAAEVNKAKLDSVDDAGAAGVQPPGRRRLPPDSRSPGHRRGAHRHARPLARPADDRCDCRRQGRLRREAGVEHHPAHQRDARRLQEGEAGRPDRHAAAELGSLHRGEAHARHRRAREGHAHLHRAARQLRAAARGRAAGARRPRLGHVAGAGAEEAVQADAGWRSAAGTTTAAGWWPTGARTTSTWRTGS